MEDNKTIVTEESTTTIVEDKKNFFQRHPKTATGLKIAGSILALGLTAFGLGKMFSGDSDD